MMRRILVLVTMLVFVVGTGSVGFAGDMEILGVTFPGEKVIEGKTLKLNGVAYRKALGIVKVYVVGLYLEHPSKDPKEVINSEQVKHLFTHYLTSKATAKKLHNGYIEAVEKCNSSEVVEAQRANIEKFASWMNKDMAPGLTTSSVYVPGKGLTYTFQGELKGTIPGSEFMKLSYRTSVGEKTQKKMRKGLLGL